MNLANSQALPPNPYQRQPIRTGEALAGRSSEKKAIRYYLSLTAAGQSPHLALIGQRGVGKTSLLNSAEAVASELHLLPIRLDMNERKAGSVGLFWRDLYIALALGMVNSKCWGGPQGKIYGDLLQMIYARQGGSIQNAVLQVPYLLACHQGAVDDFECPDALVINDLRMCLAELKGVGLSGIAFLIDEADCLGRNVPLLQMFRNIFQVVEHCSLLLAGTEAVFPALSEVFSPIPRQFHRIDIRPFVRWPETMHLVQAPLSAELFESVGPTTDVVRALHDLGGGAPDEIQLYCHHMYRRVEDGSSTRMSLSPLVFRDVLREYRSNAAANVDVLNAIERLPDKLLFGSRWLSRRALTVQENCRVSILLRELKLGHSLSDSERAAISHEIESSYRELFDRGISEVADMVRLTGAPLTAGFWKSFVEVERGERWTWTDSSYSDHIRRSLVVALGKACDADHQMDISKGQDAVAALQLLREGRPPIPIDEGMAELIFASLLALDDGPTNAIDVLCRVESPAGKETFQCRFLESAPGEILQEQLQAWIESHRELLFGNAIELEILEWNRWKLPSSFELHRLSHIAGHPLPAVFGPSLLDQAISKFADGDLKGCMETFETMLGDRDDVMIRNNLAFCQILSNEPGRAVENLRRAIDVDYQPLYGLNYGIASYLLGDGDSSKESLQRAIRELGLRGGERDEVAYTLVMESDGQHASPHAKLPVGAAALITLWRIGAISSDDLARSLGERYPKTADQLLGDFEIHECSSSTRAEIDSDARKVDKGSAN